MHIYSYYNVYIYIDIAIAAIQLLDPSSYSLSTIYYISSPISIYMLYLIYI